MFAYCNNNPVMCSDVLGYQFVSIRTYVESRNGVAIWYEKEKRAEFILCGKTLYVDNWGAANASFRCFNDNGRFKAEYFELDRFFDEKTWAKRVPGFCWYPIDGGEGLEGFQVDTIPEFESKQFCIEFAESIIYMRGKDGMYCIEGECFSVEDIAMECYAHAVGKQIFGTTKSLFNKGHRLYGSSKQIGFVKDDNRRTQYKILWWGTIWKD